MKNPTTCRTKHHYLLRQTIWAIEARLPNWKSEKLHGKVA